MVTFPLIRASFLKLAFHILKGTLSSLRKFLATESPIKIVKNAFYFGNRTIPPWTIGPPPPEQLHPGKLLLKTAPRAIPTGQFSPRTTAPQTITPVQFPLRKTAPR